MSRIVLISPFRDLTLIAQEVAAELGITLETHEGAMEESRAVIDKLSGRDIDVFISRGGTADFIAHNYNIPVITIDVGLHDVIAGCEEARKYSNNIVITSFAKPIVGLNLLEKAMDISITEVVFHNLPTLEHRIAALAEEGNYCVVGGGQSVQGARKYGLPSVFLRASRETVSAALLRAAEVAELRHEEKRKAYRLKAILDSVYDGIVSVDPAGKVELMNAAAEKIFGIKMTQVAGKLATEVLPNSRLNEVMKSGKAEIGEFQDVGTRKIVANRVPVRDENEIMGAVATFQETSRVIQVENRLRLEMTKTRFLAKYRLENIIGQSTVMSEIKTMARSFAGSDFTVLIYGPSGSGKEMFAQGIHNASNRSAQPFVAINCAALPPSLLESELFGYDEGAFTGAKRKGKLGLFELAHGGTVFLDELDALPIELQGRLLRVLQEKEVIRVGGETVIPVDIRVIAATNKPPYELVAANKMREDLFYRLNVLYLQLPSLGDRKEDIPLLCHHFIPKDKLTILSEVLQTMMPVLLNYSWPGNVRELQNFCQRLLFYQENFLINKDVYSLLRQIAPNMLAQPPAETMSSELNARVEAYEHEIISAAVKEAGSIRKAAERLGIGKSTVARKLKNKPNNE